MWNRKIEKTQNETRFVKCQTDVNRTPEIRHQNAENENRQVDKWIIETWILKVSKIWKSKLGIANHKIEKWYNWNRIKDNRGWVSKIGKRKIRKCVYVVVFPMFFDSVCIRPQILPFVLNLIICPSSICFPLLYFLFLISFRFSNMFCFFVFNFATKPSFIKVTSGQG